MGRVTFVVIFIAASLMLYSIDTLGDIELSHHDFSGASWTGGRVCVVCHTPHNANTEVPDSPLWNHEVTVATYQLYQSSTLNAFPGQPSGHSKLCLSCHDGTVAVDNFGGNTGGTFFTSFGNFGTDLSHSHPISFTYNTALANADGELHDPSTTPSGLGGTIAEDLLVNGSLECSSCHDVHVSRNTQGCTGCHNIHPGGGVVTTTLSLRIPNEGSAFCFTCHNK